MVSKEIKEKYPFFARVFPYPNSIYNWEIWEEDDDSATFVGEWAVDGGEVGVRLKLSKDFLLGEWYLRQSLSHDKHLADISFTSNSIKPNLNDDFFLLLRGGLATDEVYDEVSDAFYDALLYGVIAE